MKTVKQVAKLTHTSVRTLQYYDQIHLLEPSTRSASSYRLYSDDDIAKLRQILLLRELGFSLKEIQTLISNPHSDQSSAYKHQKDVLLNERAHTDKVINILERLEHGASLDDCTEDLKTLSREHNVVKRKLKLLLFICPLLLAVGFIIIYRTLPSAPESDSTKIAETPTSIASEDEIYINTDSIYYNTASYAVTNRDFDAKLLPETAPQPAQINLPDDLRNTLETKAVYGLNLDTGEYTEFINYVFHAKNPNREEQYLYIGFSSDGELIRELYTPAGESSLINNHEVLISARIDGETNPIYVADFSTTNYTFNVEAHGLSESEFIALLKSLLSD